MPRQRKTSAELAALSKQIMADRDPLAEACTDDAVKRLAKFMRGERQGPVGLPNESVILAHDGEVGSIEVRRNDVDRLVTIEARDDVGAVREIILTHVGALDLAAALGAVLQEWGGLWVATAVRPSTVELVVGDGKPEGESG